MKKPHTASSEKRVVLVVDDDPAVRNSLKFSLEVEGFAVRLYADPYELLNETHLPANSCLLIDYYMPAMNGLELLARLRDRGVSIPAMVITGHPNRTLRDRIAAAWVPMIGKSFLENVLTERMRKALAQDTGY